MARASKQDAGVQSANEAKRFCCSLYVTGFFVFSTIFVDFSSENVGTYVPKNSATYSLLPV